MKLPKKCTGCMACFNSCKFGAITIVQNEKGFYVPKINSNKCKNCGLCEKRCPQLKKVKKTRWINCYAAWTKNEKTRYESTSGGVFYELANSVIENNGIVVGVAMENNKVVHTIIRNKEELNKLQGSKYVQSYIGTIFQQIKKELDNGVFVLFSGVGCQIAGLKLFLNKEYYNLLTVDVLCHGVPSPRIFEDYINHKGIIKINKINFRYKKPSWTVFSMKINYNNNKEYKCDTCTDEYLRFFLSDYITNDVCSNCKYVGEKRISDITLADFWGYVSEKKIYKNDEKGISLVLINTHKGEIMFKKIYDKMIVIEKQVIEAKNGNRCLSKAFPKNRNYYVFWRDYTNHGYEYCVKKYHNSKRMSLKRKLSLFINDHAYIIPNKIRNVLYNKKYRFKGKNHD